MPNRLTLGFTKSPPYQLTLYGDDGREIDGASRHLGLAQVDGEIEVDVRLKVNLDPALGAIPTGMRPVNQGEEIET